MESRALKLSIALSIFAMYLVIQYVSGEDKRLNELYADFTPMVVASKDILQFQTIRPTDVEVIRVPAAMVPPGRIYDPKDVVDAVAAVPIMQGEHILDNKIISKNIYSGLDTQIAISRRAISIPVNTKSALGYMVEPGNRVDVAAQFDYKAKGVAINETKVFLQDILVLASGRTIQTSPPDGVDQLMLRKVSSQFGKGKEQQYKETLNFATQDQNFQTVTLEVTPEQAQQIAYVMTVYPDSITLLLRNSDDRQLQRTATTNLYDIMGPDSYLIRSQRLPPPAAVPRTKFFDFVGGQAQGVRESQ
ncbi:MAG: Flp pilus assembly protein CpaB [Bdellovibrionaceae bacterium]|nr:Flp pilus assembly protein CpaB [Bdellovibrionales bacterium]MCB9254515.1 Flp pilus assembly protein CpaB [Pseudobdellovibrionaceae bacterium]